MQFFKESGVTYMDAVSKVKTIYGNKAKILNHKSIRYGGILGLFQKEGVEVEGYIDNRQTLGLEKFNEEKNKIITAAGNKKDDKIEKLFEEIKLINQNFERFSEVSNKKEPQNIEKIEELLIKNEFTHNYIKYVSSRLKSELSLEQIKDYSYVKDKTFEYIKGSIRIYKKNMKNKIKVIVGPTGVGKTTTVAKLAALNSIGMRGETPKKVRMINTDNYRIGANKQIQTYGELMEIPIACVETLQEFRNKLLLYNEADMILVDTMGRSPRDYHSLAEIREYLDVCGEETEIFLAVSATTKAEDIKDIYNEFSSFGINAIILTKLDETTRVGSIISVIEEIKVPLVYITDGQVVPQDIKCAETEVLIKRLESFTAKESLVIK